MATNEHEQRTTPTQDFLPAGTEIRDEVIAEIPAGTDVGDAAAMGEEAGNALPPRGKGPAPDRTVADRLRERRQAG